MNFRDKRWKWQVVRSLVGRPKECDRIFWLPLTTDVVNLIQH
ncbi:MAG TPA: hypothetical protein V6D48_22540 [Oculatellaceae cyanobacterium]